MARFQVQELARIHPYTYTIRFPNVTYVELGSSGMEKKKKRPCPPSSLYPELVANK